MLKRSHYSYRFSFLIKGLRTQNQVSPYRQRTDNNSSFLSKDLSKTAELLPRSSLSKFTTSAYKSEYRMYNQFLELSFPKKPRFSLPLQHLLAFIAHCFFQSSAASTACTLVSALSFIVQLSYFADTVQHFMMNFCLQGFQKVKPLSYSRLPITPQYFKIPYSSFRTHTICILQKVSFKTKVSCCICLCFRTT